MKTKKIIVFVACLLVSLAVSAQNGSDKVKKAKKTPEQEAKKQTESLTKDLQLTDDQAKQIEDINLKFAKEGKAKREELKAEHKKQSAEKEAEFKKVLTPDQYAKFDQLKKDKKAKRIERKEQLKRCMEEQKASQAPQQVPAE